MVVCVVPVSPMRRESTHRAEMVSELLFGEYAEVLEKTKDFTRIRGLYDGYEGWCQSNQLAAVDNISTTGNSLSAEWASVIDCNGQPMHISLGTPLDILNDGKAQIGTNQFAYTGKTLDPSQASFNTEALTGIAMQYLNTPYLWGGRSVFGIDCSGFAQQVFRFFDQPLPRDAYQQVDKGEVVGFLAEARKGDLAYFDNEEGRITHVGILLGPDTIIHASGKVRIDKIDSMGIMNVETGERTHKLRIIKRVF